MVSLLVFSTVTLSRELFQCLLMVRMTKIMMTMLLDGEDEDEE